MNSSRAYDLSCAELIEALDEGDADLDFGSLAVWVSRGDAFSECLEASHLGLDPASDLISGPALPERPSIVPSGAFRCERLRASSLFFTAGRSCGSG